MSDFVTRIAAYKCTAGAMTHLTSLSQFYGLLWWQLTCSLLHTDLSAGNANIPVAVLLLGQERLLTEHRCAVK